MHVNNNNNNTNNNDKQKRHVVYLFGAGTFGQTGRHVDSRRFCLRPRCSRNGHWLQRPWTSPELLGGSNAGGQLRAICLQVTAVTPSAGVSNAHRLLQGGQIPTGSLTPEYFSKIYIILHICVSAFVQFFTQISRLWISRAPHWPACHCSAGLQH